MTAHNTNIPGEANARMLKTECQSQGVAPYRRKDGRAGSDCLLAGCMPARRGGDTLSRPQRNLDTIPAAHDGFDQSNGAHEPNSDVHHGDSH